MTQAVPPAPAPGPPLGPTPGIASGMAPGLAALRAARIEGVLEPAETVFAPGVALHGDPALALAGSWRSPAGRLLELEAEPARPGGWLALHVALDLRDLPDAGWLGFACQGAAAREMMIRPCLRSGTGEGFADSFFPRHILAGPEAASHVDALPLATTPGLPTAAPWRELLLFLPREAFAWHLHDLRLFLI